MHTLPLRTSRNTFARSKRPIPPLSQCVRHQRCFHDYFVTHLPSSSVHPDARSSTGPHHKLPRDKSTPHDPNRTGRSPASMVGVNREMTVVRIPLRSAKHHFGSSVSRGNRPYNEDAFQAGTIEIPAFAKRRPISLTRLTPLQGAGREGTSADSANGDPQVFYFGVFDGHGGNECSDFLKDRLHGYVEDGARDFELESSLKKVSDSGASSTEQRRGLSSSDLAQAGRESLDAIETRVEGGTRPAKVPAVGSSEKPASSKADRTVPPKGAPPLKQSESKRKAEELERGLVNSWKEVVGGYFKRFKPQYFSLSSGGQGHILEREVVRGKQMSTSDATGDHTAEGVGIETVLTYAFLKADLDFVAAQASKRDDDPVLADRPLNDDDVLGKKNITTKGIGGSKRFKGGSTCSIALISTPTPTPFWHPASPATLITSHVGDTRILVCSTATGLAVHITSDHHPSHPVEAERLRRYASVFTTDSFGEERVLGLANTRAFGDIASKRIGVSAEPEIRRLEMSPAEYSFLVLVSDGVSGSLGDQEIVDIVKEARTPDQASRDVVSFAVDYGGKDGEADNATALVVRLGGWERRSEGGLGSMGTKEVRDWRKQEALDPRSRRT
ncbi:hypothetical protein LTR04_005477 [Oleoguttula sp. CCFEE 6159]|nr:hypothetical protein LTR04_005477 [Oleoguttula sp. CCFEE 6159]